MSISRIDDNDEKPIPSHMEGIGFCVIYEKLPLQRKAQPRRASIGKFGLWRGVQRVLHHVPHGGLLEAAAPGGDAGEIVFVY